MQRAWYWLAGSISSDRAQSAAMSADVQKFQFYNV